MLVATTILAACSPDDRVVAVQAVDGSAAQDGGARFGPARVIAGLVEVGEPIQDGTLSSDELEIYFSSDHDGTFDVWRSTRSAIDQPWPRGQRVDELSTPDRDFEPDLSFDGLTMHLASDRPIGGASDFRVFVARRVSASSPWSTPTPVRLSPSSGDRGPGMAASGLAMIVASGAGAENFDLYLASRRDPSADWDTPVVLTTLNSAWQDWDAALFRDGFSVAFASRRAGDHSASDLFEGVRAGGGDFGDATAMTELNTALSEGDPWLSNDGRHVVFTSNRDGVSQLYEAWR